MRHPQSNHTTAMLVPKLNTCGHPEREHIAKGMCRACYDNAYRAANPERKRAQGRSWREANLEHARAQARAYRAANPEHANEQQRAWRAANLEHVRAQGRSWREANLEHARAQARARYAKKKAATCSNTTSK